MASKRSLPGRRLTVVGLLPFAVLVLSGAAWGATFGNTSGVSTFSVISYENQIAGQVFTLTEDGLATSMTAYISSPTASHNAKCAIFRAADTFLVAYTEQIATGTTAGAEFTFAFKDGTGSPISIRLYAGDYRLCVWGNNAAGFGLVGHDAGSSATYLLQSATFGTQTVSPMVSSTVTASSPTQHIFCTYTPTSSFGLFGDTTIGSTTSSTADVIQMGLYTSPTFSVIVDSASAWIDLSAHTATSSTRKFKMALYNVDSTLIAASDELAIETANNVDGYYNFTFGTPPTLTASKAVRIAVWSDTSYATITVRYNASAGTSIRVVSPYTYTPHTGTFPDPAASELLDADARLNVIAYYHAVPTGIKPRRRRLIEAQGIGMVYREAFGEFANWNEEIER